MVSGGSGIGDWKDNRFRQLKDLVICFIDLPYRYFLLKYELNTSKTETKIKLLSTDKLDEAVK